MAAIDEGRICYKKTGGKAGEKTVVLDIEGSFATCLNKHGKKAKSNIRHLFPTTKTIEIKNKTVEEIMKMLRAD